MELMLSHQRAAPAIAAVVIGIAVSWLTTTPFGFLGLAAGLFFFARGRVVLLLYVAAAIGLLGSLLGTTLAAGSTYDLAKSWAAFFALAPCIGAVVATGAPASARVETLIRSETRDETPSYPVVGPTLSEKSAPRSSRVVSIAAADDRATQALVLAASFWGGTPFNVRYWRRRSDGDYRWMEVRTEAVRQPSGTLQWSSFSAEISDQTLGSQQPTKIAISPAEDDDAIRAAKVVERLLGNSWAFDANGRPTYLTPFAQTFVSATLDEFQASVDEGYAFLKRTSHPDDYETVATSWRHSLKTGEPFYIERRIRRASGIYDWSRTAIVPTRDRLGRVTGWYGASMDLDAYRTVEVVLRERERELSKLVDMVPSHIWRLTPDGEPVFFNKRMVDFLGVDVADTDKPGTSRLEVLIASVIHPDDRNEFANVLNRSLQSGALFSLRYRLRRVDGVYHWMSSRAEPLRNEDGDIVQWYGICHDIDDQMRADEVLRESEARLRRLIDALPAMIWCTTPDGKPTYVNKRFTDVTGAALSDIIAPNGSFSLSVIHPDDKETTAKLIGAAFKAGNPYVTQYRQLRRDGSYRWTETRAEALRDETGAALQWYGVSVDIHDLVIAQEELRQSERRLQQLVETLPAMIYCATPTGEPTYRSRQLRDYLGFDVHERTDPGGSRLTGTLDTVIHPDDLAVVRERYAHSLSTGEPYAVKHRLRRVDGEYRWVETRAAAMRNADGEIVQWNGICIDVDEQVGVQEALQRRERELSQLVNLVPVFIRRLTPDGDPVFFNKRLTDFIGVDLADIGERDGNRLAPAVEDFVHPDEAGDLLATIRRSMATGIGYTKKYRMRRVDGAYRWLETRAEPVRDQDGTIAQWYVVSIDVDDEVRAQEALRQSESELSQLVDMVPVHIRRLALNGEATFFNKRLIDFLGMELADLRRLDATGAAATIRNFVHPDDMPMLFETFGDALAEGKGWALKYRLRRADGVYRWVDGRAEPMRNQNGEIVHYYAISVDIDDQMRAQHAEEALRETSDKLAQATQAASLAELSASIAHEVNQPLAAIIANSHACHRWLEADPPNIDRAKITAERIIRDANSAADVVSRIRALFRQSVERRDEATVMSVIIEVGNLIADEAARRRVRVEVDADRDLPLVALDRIQIQQVLINLIRNAMDAMDEVAGDKVARVRVHRIGIGIQIEVSDRGPGVEFPDRIFEPFFTTKEQGMGMGLAICRSIVESHGGQLWAEKNEPNGATFVFTLPVEMKTAS